jgi:lipopolysaccharide transport system ATP-binding protein
VAEIAIRAEKLGKLFQIAAEQAPYRTVRESVVDVLKAPLRRAAAVFHGQASVAKREPFWALRDVSFGIRQGEVVGVVGRNGAGKTTLLKLLSRISEPTEGYAEIRGRVGSLLEVGTGFHPELTGRENIYLNGAILGMRKAEIDRRFDAIVSFAGVERFLDTAVKHYSSGMYVRLAFAVAAHLDIEILLVDEVLAVGDTTFQRKCLARMGEVAGSGRTVLFVSHQLNQIRRLCGQCLWLEGGKVRMLGPTAETVSAYETAASQVFGQSDAHARAEDRRWHARFLQWEVTSPATSDANVLRTLEACSVRMIVKANRPIKNGHHGIALWSDSGHLIWAWAATGVELRAGLNAFEYTLPGLPLRPGPYSWQVSLYEDGVLLDNWHCVPALVVATEPQTHARDEWNGILNIPCAFEIKHLGGSPSE